MKRFTIVVVTGAMICGLSAATMSTAVAEEGQGKDKCGDKGQPSCPLQGWMEKNVQDPLDAKDFKKVAESLKKAASFSPDPKWNEGDKGWKKLAEEAAKIAEGGDIKAIKKSCKSCHKAWRKQYRKEHRMRPIK